MRIWQNAQHPEKDIAPLAVQNPVLHVVAVTVVMEVVIVATVRVPAPIPLLIPTPRREAIALTAGEVPAVAAQNQDGLEPVRL